MKQLVNFPTRGDRTLDLILTNLGKFYQNPTKDPPFGLSDHLTVTISPSKRQRSTNRKKTISVRKRNKSSVEALGRFLSKIDWSVLDSLSTIEDHLNYFSDIVMVGLNSMMPLKVVKLHVDDTPWMTPYLKDLIWKRQKALKENNTSLFKIYRNKVNSERKAAKSKYYQSKVEHLKDTDPKKWWSICKKIGGMSKANTSIVNKLLETESPSTNSKIKLANDINSAFLEPLQSYSKLSPSSKTAVTDHPVPHVTIESVERKLRTIKEFKAPGPDDISNWLLKNFSYLLAEPICYLINSSYQKQCLPTIWKKANVIPLPKNLHIQEFNKDLRPISLTPTLSKIAEDYVVQEHVKPAVL